MANKHNEEYIYKICSTKNWKITKQIGVFKGFGIDLIDGYIHFSSKNQVKETARLHFNGEKELLLLKIETKNLEIKWEKSRNNQFNKKINLTHSQVWEVSQIGRLPSRNQKN